MSNAPDNETLLALLTQKKELVFKLLRMANDIDLNEVNTENAEKYISFIETREGLIDELKMLNDKIEEFRGMRDLFDKFRVLSVEIEEMIRQLARLERGITESSAELLGHVQKEIRDMNKRKKVMGIYESY